MNKYFVLSILFASSLAAYSQTEESEDEAKIKELDEVVVKGKNAWIEDGKYIFVPTKKEKNLARNMEGLIDRMHTGVLFVEDGQIKTKNGQSVSIFVNGVPADNMEKATFWAKNALRVEFMESSDDPRFIGCTNIVNFVMREYVAGGLTKFDVNQQFPNDGSYSAASKLVWGKMTYNALFKGGYSRDHQSGNETTEHYDGINYNGSFYERVSRYENAKEVNRSNDIYGGFSAIYKTDKLTVSHNVALQWNENPGSITQGTVAYSPAIISSDMMLSRANSHSLSPSLEGLYIYYPSSKWSFAFWWVLNHSHNNNYASYTDIGLEPIQTDSRENTYGVLGRFTVGWYLRKNMVFSFAVLENRTISDVDYSGNTISRQWQNNGNTKFEVGFWYKPTDNIVFKVTPEISLSDRNVNHMLKRTDWLPGVNANLFFGIDDKNSLSLESWYYQRTPVSSTRNDLILKSTELKWIEGNPYMDSSSNYWLSLAYYSYPSSWFNQNFSFNFISHSNDSYLEYRVGGTEYDGVIGKYMNAPVNRTYKLTWAFGIDLFDGNVRLGNQFNYNYQRVAGRGLNSVRTRPYISWDFGNCSISANYGTPERFYSQGGTQKIKTSSYYGLSFSYGNGNLLFDVELNSLFRKYATETIEMNSGPYRYTSRDWSNGRNVSVSLTYTFDYGKKVTPGIDISEKNLKSTSVLGSD